MRTGTQLLALGLLLAACSRGGASDPEPGGPAASDLSKLVWRDLGPDLARADLALATPAMPRFTAGTRFASPGTFGSVAAADLNGDGVSDILLGTERQGGFGVMLGKGDGTLGTLVDVSGPTNNYATTFVLAVDVTGDGILDAVASSFSSSFVMTAVGKGDGTFLPSVALPMPPTAEGIAVADFDGDRKVDLAVACAKSNQACLLSGRGDGTFVSSRQIAVATSPVGAAAADLDGDTRPDVAFASFGGEALSLLFGNGDGTFRPLVKVPTTAGPDRLVIADLNRDGVPDLVTSSDLTHIVTVHLGKGAGAFGEARSYPTGTSAYGLLAVDLNGDGRLDVATADLRGNVAVFAGRGDGTLESVVLVPTGLPNTYGLATGDFNRDGRPDLVTVASNAGGGVILLNTTGVGP